MSAATFSPAPGRQAPPAGTTALRNGTASSRHRFGDAVRAVTAFAGAALDVVILGEYAEEAGVRRR
ncbi:hypothetical protein QFZ63_004460 [Streptomyces sp. B3I7]|uniref:hypothetical protein n=1 Tax=unclassified Streptomyces TaxID=2593676 RepID=UPI00278A1B94|nr:MULTISPECIES: hypothetical protein [unclassified Streptomyces]MDQ0787687.1 hypothetical protein [Streptomyces sp. B3I8]MDQ0812746.1 hypothetical protein [Streptomyces sp. B3I7]